MQEKDRSEYERKKEARPRLGRDLIIVKKKRRGEGWVGGAKVKVIRMEVRQALKGVKKWRLEKEPM